MTQDSSWLQRGEKELITLRSLWYWQDAFSCRVAHSLIELGMRVIVLLEIASKSCDDFVKFSCATTILVQQLQQLLADLQLPQQLAKLELV